MRILIADDHEVVRRGVRTLLLSRAGFDVCGEAVDGRDAVTKAQQLRPDVITMDVSMPNMNGLEATREIRRLLPETKVLVLSQHDVPEVMKQALKAGASGYVVKSAISAELIGALGRLRMGQTSFGVPTSSHGTSRTIDAQEVLQRAAMYEKALRESEERFRLAQQAARVGTFELNVKTGAIRWTPELESIHGLNRGTFPGTRRAWEELIHPADRLQTLAKVERALKEGAFEGEWRVIWPDGSVHWLLGRASVIQDEWGEPDRFIGVNIDVTEQRNAEEASRVSQRQLALALTSSKTALFEWDMVSATGKWNPHMAAIYGFTPENSVIDKEGWKRVFHPHEVERLMREAAELFAKQDEFHFEFRAIRPDGSLRWVLSKGRVLRDEDGKPTRLIGTHTDITDRKTAEEAAAKGVLRQAAVARLSEDLHRADSLDAVYRAAFDALAAAFRCDRASILLYDDSGIMRFVAWRELSDAYRQKTEGHSPWKRDETNPNPLCIADVKQSDIEEGLKATVLAEGIRALSFTPLVSQGRIIGKFMLYYDQPHEFTADEVEVSQTIARQVAFGIEHKRAEETLETAAQRLLAEAAGLAKLNDCSARLWRMASLDEGLEEMLTAVIELLGADKGNLQLLHAQNGLLRLVAHRGFGPDFVELFEEVKLEDATVCATALRTGQVVVVEDINADDNYMVLREIARRADYRAVVSVPLTGTDGQLLGIISAHFREAKRPSEGALRRLNLYARQGADFVQRCRTQSALRDSEEHARAIVETTPECVTLLARDGTVIEMNVAGLRMVGADSADQVIGKSVYGLIAPKDRERYRQFNETVCAGKKGSVEFDVVGLKGARRRMESHAVPLRQPLGTVVQLSVTRDITKRRQAEEAQNRLAAIVESSDDAIISKDLRGVITSWNSAAERIFGYSSHEAIGRPITIIIPPELHEEEHQILARVRAGERMDHFETIRRAKNGSTLHVSLTISPMRDDHGRIVGASKIARDITERRRADHAQKEAELSGRLLQLQDEERRHIARELHDGVGQLLAALNMNISAVSKEKEKLGTHAARCVEQNSEIVEQITSEIRTMSHLLHPPLLDEVGLQSALKEYVNGFAERSNIPVTLNISSDLERLPREWELSLFRIVQECLTNIHRHSGSASALVRLSRTQDDVQLEVADQGRGIPAEIQEKFFAGKSSGVGLRGMRERVRRIGGSLQIYSQGNGTSVRVVLPAPQAKPAAEIEDARLTRVQAAKV